jgi:TetR/AcrR family transcriptional repressor of mexJK operon
MRYHMVSHHRCMVQLFVGGTCSWDTMTLDHPGESHVPQRQKAVPAVRKRLPDERIAELLDIATEMFITEGFAATSTNKIARAANASKTTFYSRFPTKQDLFLAVIERRMQGIFEQVAQFPENANFEKTLCTFSANLLRIALAPRQISLIRMISMEADRYPELARRFYENGPKRGEDSLAAYLSTQIKLGRLRDDDPLTMARHLMSLLTGSPVRWFVIGLNAEPISELSLRGHIDDVVNIFLRAYAPPGVKHGSLAVKRSAHVST